MEISLELAEAYLNDRVNELINYDVKAGTPFVFLSAFTLLNILLNAGGKIDKILPDTYKDDQEKYGYGVNPAQAIVSLMTKAMLKFSLVSDFSYYGKLDLSHVEEDHLSFNKDTNRITLSALPFLLDVREGIENFFNSCRSDKVLAAKAFVYFNENKFIGLGGDA